jgi:hypothetical protein
MRLRLTTLFVAVLLTSCSNGGGADNGLGQLDPRCQSLCMSSDTACSADVTACQPLCQLRVAGMSSSCATCLLDGSNGGTCSSSSLCCPRPNFPSTALHCASSCAGSAGVNPSGTHPICNNICSNSDGSCSAQVDQCIQQCQARIQGVSGLCALCLLDGANGGTCSTGMLCCPHPEFPTSVTACASVCN